MRLAGKILLYFLSIGVAGYAVVAYTAFPIGSLVHPDMLRSFQAHRIEVYAHIFTSAVALLLGPLQFSQALRARKPALHRWLGRAYLGLGVLPGGLAGLLIARNAYGGMLSTLGFAALAIAWLYSGLRAYLAIRQRDIGTHRRWMIRNFALTLAAVTLRCYLPLSMLTAIPFEQAYPVIAWLCWVPNLLIAERWLRRSNPH
ncbi:DUF2306 domain-containing protein [Leeia aquatica]|uniref:DUF2306 domain-containing protein n=1 Tax=Leeia aquatica TaxID=2725557 RepID=A0A847SCN1_9NEIS|nr:DUF2306 domain-containing protein [Leeia aquatica]NLR73712.1 DUF2306 domain-containing protein [Leeia aquatica]